MPAGPGQEGAPFAVEVALGDMPRHLADGLSPVMFRGEKAKDVRGEGAGVWKTVDPKKPASGEEEIDKRLNGKINVISLFIACVSTLGLML